MCVCCQSCVDYFQRSLRRAYAHKHTHREKEVKRDAYCQREKERVRLIGSKVSLTIGGIVIDQSSHLFANAE